MLIACVVALVGAGEARAEPTEVRVGAYINDVQDLSLESHSYTMDVYVWFRWTDPDIDPSTTLEFMNPTELWGHILTKSSEEPEKLPDGSFYQLLRNQGKFNTKLPLHRYPFDTQKLTVEFEDSELPAGELRFVPDTDAIDANPLMTLPGYRLGTPELRVVEFPYASSFGREGARQPYSRVVIEVPVERPAATYSVKLFMPVLIVLISAGLMYLVRPDYVEGRIGIGVTALLTLVALQLTTNAQLPSVEYLTLLDKVYMASYAFIVVGIALVARTSWMDADRDLSRAVRFDRRSLAVATTAYVGTLAVVMATSLT